VTRRFLIATYNRAALLHRTLASIRDLRVAPGRTWDVIVVDNNSTDDTRSVVERHARDFPVPSRTCSSRGRDARAH
jgi:glycosyltransferase involved in cell wall biosynthesis